MSAPASPHARGRDAYPSLRVDEEAFRRLLRRALDAEPPVELDALAVEDLYLACACAEGVRGAAAAFERKFQGAFRRAIARVLKDSAQRQDAEQRLRQHLLVAERGRPARIAEYLGRAPLESWVSVTALRLAISCSRQTSADRRLQVKALAEITAADPERLLIREEVRAELNAAVAGAVARLPGRERLALRLFLVSGMSATAIGKALGVTQQGASKYLANARDRLRADVQATLKKRLKLHTDDLTSLMRVITSQFDVSLAQVLVDGDP
jgi:RNA polymerase sigma-70 factor, ECF subfamily